MLLADGTEARIPRVGPRGQRPQMSTRETRTQHIYEYTRISSWRQVYKEASWVTHGHAVRRTVHLMFCFHHRNNSSNKSSHSKQTRMEKPTKLHG